MTRLRLASAAVVLLGCLLMIGTAVAQAEEKLIVHASFTPDAPSASTNLSLTASFASGDGDGVPPSPITKFTLYAPAGIGIDTRGAGTCAEAALEQHGPGACPADSRAGFGGGVGVLALPSETIHEPYTLDFFFASKTRGHLRLLVYASAIAPVSVALVVVAKQVPAPPPYGLGFSVEVPPISTFPGAPDASLESAFVTVGGANVAYYEPVAGRRKLVHVKGLLVPKRCPSTGFPAEGIVDFANGSTTIVNSTIPCPHG
jgi:hypothetical protein